MKHRCENNTKKSVFFLASHSSNLFAPILESRYPEIELPNAGGGAEKRKEKTCGEGIKQLTVSNV